jgi:hypothetical protein
MSYVKHLKLLGHVLSYSTKWIKPIKGLYFIESSLKRLFLNWKRKTKNGIDRGVLGHAKIHNGIISSGGIFLFWHNIEVEVKKCK